ncbi:MAG TPA: PIN domain-containing protein [Candidatus Acidoferrales bacterium]|jgi:predicted nucleic acid-binding protein|nr:PIN domain-containing protein [Candidatus Acidoferrales bacterium]
MIALDTSSAIAFLSGERGRDVTAVEEALRFRQGVFPPVVVTELLSDPLLRSEAGTLIRAVPRLEVLDGYWERAGELRARLLRRGLKARLADTLIAQSCIDHEVALVTRDRDFRNFATHAGLSLD